VALDEWVKFGWLRPHTPAPREIQDLLKVAERDLKDAASDDLSIDWQFAIAYNAGLQLARTALLAAGYETPKGESHHFRAIDALPFLIEVDKDTISLFQAFRKKRAAGVYETVGLITAADAKEMLALAKLIRTQVRAFLQKQHPLLLK
jgi:hypothetical protein